MEVQVLLPLKSDCAPFSRSTYEMVSVRSKNRPGPRRAVPRRGGFETLPARKTSLKHLLSSQYILSPHYLLGEYFFIFIFPVVSLLISSIVSAPSSSSSSRSVDKEKVSAYECGFSPSEDARNQSDARSYPVATSSTTSDPEVSSSSP